MFICNIYRGTCTLIISETTLQLIWIEYHPTLYGLSEYIISYFCNMWLLGPPDTYTYLIIAVYLKIFGVYPFSDTSKSIDDAAVHASLQLARTPWNLMLEVSERYDMFYISQDYALHDKLACSHSYCHHSFRIYSGLGINIATRIAIYIYPEIYRHLRTYNGLRQFWTVSVHMRSCSG